MKRSRVILSEPKQAPKSADRETLRAARGGGVATSPVIVPDEALRGVTGGGVIGDRQTGSVAMPDAPLPPLPREGGVCYPKPEPVSYPEPRASYPV